MEEKRFKLLSSIHVLFIKEDEILMLLRKNILLDGLYSIIAGHLDGGETVLEAAIRESKEECGVDVNPENIEVRTVCHSFSRHNNREYVQFYAICKKWSGQIVNMEPSKCGEIKFFPINELPQNTVPYIKDGIEKTLSGVHFYEYGWIEGQD